ncbi:MAG TPA: adenylate/guanylate cyclase domain-containing protein [Candidatus Limnocylindrales bacterium]|nr:adenylate/guanylate cyclase domain-containing protein [Candidatus Limnocylindrales bacterium]
MERAALICPGCGVENRAGRKFCSQCGEAFDLVCSRCGMANEPGARFCGECGTQLQDRDGEPSTSTSRGPTAAGPEGAGSTAERRMVSVLFADLVGFTTLAEDRDPETVRDLLSRYFDTARATIERHGGVVEKFIGDAVMAVWGTPTAHEDDAERAVRAALELVDAVSSLGSGLSARAGVLTGEAAVTIGATNQGMVAGDLVNTAARLQGVADPGTVLVGETTMRAASGSIAFEPIGDQTLKGKTTPVPAWRATRVVAARGGHGRSDMPEPPFVGRTEELRQLKDLLHATGRDRRTRLVSITGPAGIGKSRLAWELEKYVDGVTDDVWWHRGRSPSYGEGITFWALGEIVRRRAGLIEGDDEPTTRSRIRATVEAFVADEAEREQVAGALLALLGVEPAPAAGRDALFPAWRTFFERIAERGTTVLVFEDLQWADTGLLDFIDHLLGWTRALPIMVITLARPELFDRRPDWGAGHRTLTAMALDPLAPDDMRTLLDGLVPGLPEPALAAIVDRAEGIPLYAVETVRSLLADGQIRREGDVYRPVGDLTALRVPETLRSLVASRLDALDAGDRSLLQDASVLGQVFGVQALAAVTGRSEADLAARLGALSRRQFIELETDPHSPERGQYRFVQSVIREVAYATLANRDRRARHLAVARYYESLGDDEVAGALANHYLSTLALSEPGPESDAVAAQARLALRGAADRAAELGAQRQAVAYLEQALGITHDARERAPLLDRAAAAAASAAIPEAEVYAQRALAAYEEIGEAVAAALARARLGRVLLDASQITRALEVLEQAVADAEQLEDPGPLATALANLSRACMRLALSDRAVAAADRALAIAEHRDLEPEVAEAFINKSSALGQLGRRREATLLGFGALEVIRRVGDRGTEIRILNNTATHLSLDDPERAAELLLEGTKLARDIGNRGMYNWILGVVAMLRYSQGRDWDEQVRLLREAHEEAGLPADRLRLRGLASVFETARGEHLEAYDTEVRTLIAQEGDVDDRVVILLTASGTARALGRPTEAYATAMELWALAPPNPELPLLAALGAAIEEGDAAHIREAASRLLEGTVTGASIACMKAHARGAIAAADGRVEDAVRSFLAAHDGYTELGLTFEAAIAAIEALTALPDAPELRARVDAVRPLLEDLRARPWLDRLDRALQRSASQGAATGATTAATPTA